MKKFVLIVVAALLAVGCSRKNGSFEIVGGGLEAVRIAIPVKAEIWFEVVNNTGQVSLSDISGKVKKAGAPLLAFTAEDFTIPGRIRSKLIVSGEAAPEPGVGLLSLARLFSSQDFSGFTVSVTFTARGFLGIKKTQTIEDIPLQNIVGLI